MLSLDALKNIKNLPIKAFASNKFIESIGYIDSGSLDEKKSITRDKEGKFDFKYKITFEQGLNFLRIFSERVQPNEDTLKAAANKFFEAIEIKKNKAEPYLYLSYIFNYLGEKELSLNYLKVATAIDPNIQGKDLLIKRISEVEKKDKEDSQPIRSDKAVQTSQVSNPTLPGEVKFKPEAIVTKRFPSYPKY